MRVFSNLFASNLQIPTDTQFENISPFISALGELFSNSIVNSNITSNLRTFSF